MHHLVQRRICFEEYRISRSRLTSMEVYSYSWTGYRYLIFLLSIVHVVMSLVIKSLLNYHREVLHVKPQVERGTNRTFL